MEEMIIYKCSHQILWRFVAIFVVLPTPLSLTSRLLLMQLLGDDDDADAGEPRAPRRSPPTTH